MNRPASPTTSGRPPDPPKKPSFKDLVEAGPYKFAIALILAGGAGVLSAIGFIESQVKKEMGSAQIRELIASQVPAAVVSKGAIVLYSVACPKNFEDITDTHSGSYLFVDGKVSSNVITYPGDGTHT